MMRVIVYVGLVCYCVANVVSVPVDNIYNEKVVEGVVPNQKQAKGMKYSALDSLWICGGQVSCWLDRAEGYLDTKRNELLGNFNIILYSTQ